MSTVLRDARIRHSVGVRELARRCGVAAPTVLDWERSEAAGTIQSGTLRRALNAMGERLTITSRSEHAESIRLERREQRLGLELHRKLAMKLIDNPDHVIAVARENLGALRDSVQGGAIAWTDRWEQLVLSRDLGGLVDVMLGTTQADIDMRSVSPFRGLLSEAERSEVLKRATAS
jgi:transcriptional regulator with XRE-family HTH domain